MLQVSISIYISPPTVDEVTRLADAMPARYRAGVVALAGSGLRVGEQLGLELRHVDFLRRTIRVDQQRLPNGQIGRPKTASSVRTVPLSDHVGDTLAAHLAAHPTDDALFLTPAGHPLGYPAWAKHWQQAREAA